MKIRPMVQRNPDVKIVRLTQGMVAIVDAEDYPALAIYKWCALWEPKQGAYYAARGYHRGAPTGNRPGRRVRSKNTGYNLTMGRAILGLEYQDDFQCFYLNGDTLDNRRHNLAVVPRGNAGIKIKPGLPSRRSRKLAAAYSG